MNYMAIIDQNKPFTLAEANKSSGNVEMGNLLADFQQRNAFLDEVPWRLRASSPVLRLWAFLSARCGKTGAIENEEVIRKQVFETIRAIWRKIRLALSRIQAARQFKTVMRVRVRSIPKGVMRDTWLAQQSPILYEKPWSLPPGVERRLFV